MYVHLESEPQFTKLRRRSAAAQPGGPVSVSVPLSVPTTAASPADRPTEPVVISIEVLNGHVLVSARIDGRPATLVLDTGSSSTTLDAAWAQDAGFPTLGPPVEAMGTDRLRVALVALGPVELGSVRLDRVTAALLPLGQVNEAAGRALHGTLGYELFRRFAVEVDYRHQVLRLWEGQDFVRQGGTSVPLELVHRVPVVRARVRAPGGREVEARLIVDLGSAHLGVRLSAGFAATHAAELAGVGGYAAPIGSGVGGMLLGRVGRLAELRIGPLAFSSPTVGIAREAKGALALADFDGTVGAPVLGRLTPVVDYQRLRIILQPGDDIEAPFPADASGLMLDAPAPDFSAARVRFVVKGSPAAEAGLVERDEIVAVDGTEVTALGLDRVRGLFRAVGMERRLLVRRGAKEWGLRIVLRDLL